jgi:hypothetical protein
VVIFIGKKGGEGDARKIIREWAKIPKPLNH